MDEAHDWTDKQIEALQRKFGHVYSEAAKEMREKLEKHLKAYEKGNAEWQKLLANGLAKQKDYDKWLHQMVTDRKFMSGMVDRLSEDATAANKKAIDLINDRLPRVYAENANHAAYQVERELGWDTHSFDLYDESTVRRLMRYDEHDQIIHEVIEVGPPRPLLQNLRKINFDAARDVRWNRQKFTSAITQSILQGESIPNAAKRLMRVLNMNRNMATRAARTAMTSAENAGRIDSYKRAKRIGIDLEQEWMATLDERTRYSHRELDGQHVPVGGKFIAKSTGHELEFPGDPKAHPSETYNCFVGGTLACSDTAIERSYRHEYSGKLVTIKTASGIEFTCTPNHPILTMSGWVAANLLHEGDNLCIARIGDSRLSGVNPDVNHVQSSMEAIHNLLALHASKRVAGSDVNFHGDIPATDVEIVGKKGTLRLDVETSRGEDITELALELSDSTRLRFCPTRESFGSVMTPSTGSLCSKSISPSLLGCQFAHPQIHGIRTTAPFDPSIAEHPSDNIAGMSDAFGDSFLGISTEIGVDYIVNVEITHTRGTHVYNLQTESGYYFVGSKNTDNVIIAHNCRCTLVAWLPDIEQEDPERWSRLPNGMTYEDWKSAKESDEKRRHDKAAKVPPKEPSLANVAGVKPEPWDDEPEYYYIPRQTREKLDAIESLESYSDFERYFEDNGIKLTTDLDSLKGERRDDSINAVKEQCHKIAVAIDAYKETFGPEALSKLKRINLYDSELPNEAAYHFNVIGEDDPLAGTIRFRQWDASGRTIFHELAHAFQDSQAEPWEDAVTFAERMTEQAHLAKGFTAYAGASADTYEAERFADAFGYGFASGREEGIDFIKSVWKELRNG